MQKHIFLFLFIILISTSCKKDFATFQNGSNYTEHNQKKIIQSDKVNSLTSSSSQTLDLNTVSSEHSIDSAISNEIAKIETTQEKIVNTERKENINNGKKTSIFQKSIIQKINKTNDATEENTSKVDVIALLSTIFGGLGMLLMFSGIGWLFGLAGLILGAIGLKRKTKNRTLAILGVVLGSISTLVGLLFVIIIAAFISANI